MFPPLCFFLQPAQTCRPVGWAETHTPTTPTTTTTSSTPTTDQPSALDYHQAPTPTLTPTPTTFTTTNTTTTATTTVTMPKPQHQQNGDGRSNERRGSSLVETAFDQFFTAVTCKSILASFQHLLDVTGLRHAEHGRFYPSLKAQLQSSWKAQSLWAKLDKRAAHRDYARGKVCADTKVGPLDDQLYRHGGLVVKASAS